MEFIRTVKKLMEIGGFADCAWFLISATAFAIFMYSLRPIVF